MTTPPSTSDAILSAARSLLDQEGMDALTMRSVAGLASVGKSTIAHHFGSKAGLLDALYLDTCWHLFELITEGDTAYPAGDDVSRGRSALMSFLVEHPGLGLLLRSWQAPPLGDDGERLFREMFPGMVGEAQHAATLTLTMVIALFEYRLTLPPEIADNEGLARLYTFLHDVVRGE